MKRINMYFFGEEKVCMSDFLWFYGMIGLMVFVGIVPFVIQITDLIGVLSNV